MRVHNPLFDAISNHDLTAVRDCLAVGIDPNPEIPHAPSLTLVRLAAFFGQADILEALIEAGAQVGPFDLERLGEMDITDYMIDPIEKERDYARVAEILIRHGATPNVTAYNGRPLISTFPERTYPTLHRVLATAISKSK